MRDRRQQLLFLSAKRAFLPRVDQYRAFPFRGTEWGGKQSPCGDETFERVRGRVDGDRDHVTGLNCPVGDIGGENQCLTSLPGAHRGANCLVLTGDRPEFEFLRFAAEDANQWCAQKKLEVLRDKLREGPGIGISADALDSLRKDGARAVCDRSTNNVFGSRSQLLDARNSKLLNNRNL